MFLINIKTHRVGLILEVCIWNYTWKFNYLICVPLAISDSSGKCLGNTLWNGIICLYSCRIYPEMFVFNLVLFNILKIVDIAGSKEKSLLNSLITFIHINIYIEDCESVVFYWIGNIFCVLKIYLYLTIDHKFNGNLDHSKWRR